MMKFKFVVLLSFYFSNVFCSVDHLCLPVNLKCEYLINPIGLDSPNPRLTWCLSDDRRGAVQKAYQISVGTDSLQVAVGTGNVWATGRQESDKMLVVYSGETLKPFTRYFWSVEVWDKDGKKSALSSVASFETGMMEKKNWKGSWISDSHDINSKPAGYFRKEFAVTKKIKNARAYIAVAGLFEFYVNGTKIGDHRLDPMYTRFDRRTLYLAHDVTELLQNGKNALGVILGNGWYNHQSTAVWYFDQAPWRGRPEFCMDLRITYDDGSEETITSGNDWKTSIGPIIFNSIYTGEHYDARLEQAGWSTPKFADSLWRSAELAPAPSQNIVAQSIVPIRNVEEVLARKVTKFNDKLYVFDLGRNIAGVSKIKVKGASGTTIRLKHGEIIDSRGRVNQESIIVHYRPKDDTDPFQTDIFILSGKGEETFMPRFNYKGFQYVEVSADQPVELTKESLCGYFMHSDVSAVGSMESSSQTLNKIYFATKNSYLSNLFGYPTDCPQREKNGWTGDAHIAVETGLYSFDGITVYEKWLADHRDEQQPNGVLPAIIPTGGWGYAWANGPDWTSTIAIIPWNIYLFYGDAHLLDVCYDNIKRYVDHINDLYPSGITDWGLGDWVPVKSVAPKDLTSSLYYFTDVTILAKAAKILNKEGDYRFYSALADKIKNAINNKYLNSSTGIYGNGSQTELSAPLYWGIVPEELKSKVAENLYKNVLASGQHVDVGLLGTKTILNALSDNGYADLAYSVASQETFPSWGWWIVNGATTLYENWQIGGSNDNSLNHIMFGEIGAWYYKALGGIFPDENQPGFKNVILRPNFVPALDHFEAKHTGPYGTILSSWKNSKGSVLYSVIIPANSTAIVTLKAKDILENNKSISKCEGVSEFKRMNDIITFNLKSGNYSFKVVQ